VLSTQWLSRLGQDRFALNLSYSFYSREWWRIRDLLQVREDFNFLGDRLDSGPFSATRPGSGVALESGLVWKRIFATAIRKATQVISKPGNLLGAEQSVTFRMGSGYFSIRGAFPRIVDEKAATDILGNLTNISYNRFAIATMWGSNGEKENVDSQSWNIRSLRLVGGCNQANAPMHALNSNSLLLSVPPPTSGVSAKFTLIRS